MHQEKSMYTCPHVVQIHVVQGADWTTDDQEVSVSQCNAPLPSFRSPPQPMPAKPLSTVPTVCYPLSSPRWPPSRVHLCRCHPCHTWRHSREVGHHVSSIMWHISFFFTCSLYFVIFLHMDPFLSLMIVYCRDRSKCLSIQFPHGELLACFLPVFCLDSLSFLSLLLSLSLSFLPPSLPLSFFLSIIYFYHFNFLFHYLLSAVLNIPVYVSWTYMKAVFLGGLLLVWHYKVFPNFLSRSTDLPSYQQCLPPSPQ